MRLEIERRSASTVLLSWSNSRSTAVIEASGKTTRHALNGLRVGCGRREPVWWTNKQSRTFWVIPCLRRLRHQELANPSRQRLPLRSSMTAGLDFAWLNAEVLVSGTMPVQTALFLALVWMSNKADRRQYRHTA